MNKLSRRQFIYGSAACFTTAIASQCFGPFGPDPSEAAIAGDIRGKVFKGDAPKKLWKWSHEGFLYNIRAAISVNITYEWCSSNERDCVDRNTSTPQIGNPVKVALVTC